MVPRNRTRADVSCAPIGASIDSDSISHGLRRGLHSIAALRPMHRFVQETRASRLMHGPDRQKQYGPTTRTKLETHRTRI